MAEETTVQIEGEAPDVRGRTVVHGAAVEHGRLGGSFRSGRRGVGRLKVVAAMAGLVCVLLTSCTGSACASTVPSVRPAQAVSVGNGAVPDARLTLSDVKTGSVTLSWDKVGESPAEGYGVYRGPADSDDADLRLIATTDDALSYTATGLRAGYAYKFGVAAMAVSGDQSDMLTVGVTMPKSSDSKPPKPPSDSSVLLTAFSGSRIDVVWAASVSPDIAAYQVRRDGTLVATIDRPDPQRYSDNGLESSSEHSYTIVALDSAGNRSAPTAAKSARTLAAHEVGIRRGPYVSDVTATSALVSWWSNIASPGSVSIARRSLLDPHGDVQHHTVAVTGLRAGTLYSYTVASGQDSRQGSFRTAASPGSTFSFAAVGDFGSGNSAETETMNGIAAANTEFVQTVGDNLYPASGLPDPDFTNTLSDFDARLYRPMGPLLQTQAFFPANGNKEYYSGGAFWRNFPMPGNNHSWYSYNWADAHILVLDTEQPFDPGSDQYAFVRADLAAHQKAGWRIVALQRPPFSSTSEHSSSDKGRQFLVPLFQSFRVSLVLSGNSHNYERTFPLIDGMPVRQDGITYIVTGAGGNLFTPFTGPKPAYSAFREDTSYEFVKVTVAPNTLVAETVSDTSRAVIDRTTIMRRKPDTKPPSVPTALVAARNTPGVVYLSWKPSVDDVGVTGYQIFRAGEGRAIATVSTAAFTQTTLAPATIYSYTIRAVDAAGNLSPLSRVVVAPPPGIEMFDPSVKGSGALSSKTATDPDQHAKGRGGCASGGPPQRLPPGNPTAGSLPTQRRRPRPLLVVRD